MVEAAVKGVESGEISCHPDSALPQPIQIVLDAIDFLLGEVDNNYTADRYWAKYTMSLNKAMIYRLARHHAQAINVLNGVQAWVAAPNEAELDYIICHTQYELDVLQGTIDIYGPDLDTVYACTETAGGGSLPPLGSPSNPLTDKSEAGPALYPNPARAQLTLAFQQAGTRQVLLLGPSGALVRDYGPVRERNMQIDISKLPHGLYFVRVVDTYGAYTLPFAKE
jgi:hypothetical protein